MSDDLERRMFCWPKEWIDAAIQSGLAARSEIGCVMCQLSGDALRDAVAKFASLVIEQSEADTADELTRLRAENEAHQIVRDECFKALGPACQFWGDVPGHISALREALRSIANNSCCDKCQEAALVARAALKEGADK